MPQTVRRATGLVRAAHAPPAAAVTLFAGAYALGAVGLGAGRAALVTLVVLAGQLSVGWSNDWLDAARDVTVGRTDKPVVRGEVSPTTLRVAALAAVAASVLLAVPLGGAVVALHTALVAAAWAYNARLKSTAWSWAPYALAFGGLPSVATLAAPDPHLAPGWTTAGAALLGVGAHLANTLPDLEDDAATGVRGLPHRLGRRGTALAAAATLLVAVLVVVLGPAGAPEALGWLVIAGAAALAASAVAVALARPRSRWPFTGAMLVAALAVVALVTA
ncbi:UbiA family prenyltransferase [Cellulomonas triticagri]|uniref:Ubiquinone biosynthesis protein UbiA n=1 Tax=Cellulomonas triticagri TaxID=2483352 RepID=A0A3M2J3P3_9CELL|nr:UbiA family prenyltransferase [Cellulomonas triticagri]RMI08732.1 ubiquinone biosynthesis protein UbiA [Cellulomonas triticagri]